MTEFNQVSAEYRVALAAVREAADLCRSVQSTLNPTAVKKPDRSPVTVADFGSQALVCSRLRSVFAGDPIIAEEDSAALRADDGDGEKLRNGVVREVRRLRSDASTDDVLSWIDYGGHEEHAGRFWTLDPIDGTKGFLRGDQYAVALALISEGEVVVAALACPNLALPGRADGRGVVAGAVRGGGARLYALDDMSQIGEARVSQPENRGAFRFCESVESRHTSHSAAQTIAERMGIDADPVRLDSQAKYAVVGAGEAEIYMRLP
ncbi:MAG: 3'(2'),5'-bisphosphate nucleotidase, partial [Rhodothermales bacterium]|nr:3'(2'),5'-bisphosphate nucleotidase [Rhodothermales bacterium]